MGFHTFFHPIGIRLYLVPFLFYLGYQSFRWLDTYLTINMAQYLWKYVFMTTTISFEKKPPLQDPQTQVTRPAICKTTLVTDEDECVLDMFISNNHYFLNKPNFPICNFGGYQIDPHGRWCFITFMTCQALLL